LRNYNERCDCGAGTFDGRETGSRPARFRDNAHGTLTLVREYMPTMGACCERPGFPVDRDDARSPVRCVTTRIWPHFCIPRDNGLDIEGLAAAPGGRLFLGLRGPVLDGWACVLEIRVEADAKRHYELTLRDIARPGAPPAHALYRKHFLDLGGAGIRDLCLAGRDLLILTGPPMRGKGTSQVRRWKNALAQNREHMLRGAHLPTLLELPYREKKDHAEGITILGRNDDRLWLMVIYDSVRKDRRLRPAAMRATAHLLTLSR
jgi:hypothetical protein